MGAGHPPQTVYWEEWGVPDGLAALYLHGGPGGGLGSSRYRERFDLCRWRVIGIEQRGCGRSRPLAIDDDHDLASNTTAALIADIEAEMVATWTEALAELAERVEAEAS